MTPDPVILWYQPRLPLPGRVPSAWLSAVLGCCSPRCTEEDTDCEHWAVPPVPVSLCLCPADLSCRRSHRSLVETAEEGRGEAHDHTGQTCQTWQSSSSSSSGFYISLWAWVNGKLLGALFFLYLSQNYIKFWEFVMEQSPKHKILFPKKQY